MTTNSEVFGEFITNVERKGSIEEAIQYGESYYCLKSYRISEITAAEAIKLYESIYLKFYKGHSQIISSNWYENQLRIFVWTLASYIYLKQRRIEDLGQEDWNFFKAIFDRKDPKLFEYQSQAICSTAKGKVWQQQEEELLRKIMQQKVNKTKWNEVSKQLFQLSNKKYFRTAKQCRQKWNNHLDPSKIKGYWKAQQCLVMFEFVQEHGKKWANLVKILNDTRNEHSVKNKFNSIIKKHRKQYKNQPDEEMYTMIIARIKKTIQNKQLYENVDISFELEQQNSTINNEKDEQILTVCHSVTQNFIKLLSNFNTEDCIPMEFIKQENSKYPNINISEMAQTPQNINQHQLLLYPYNKIESHYSINLEESGMVDKESMVLRQKYYNFGTNNNQSQSRLPSEEYMFSTAYFDPQYGPNGYSQPNFDYMYNKDYF